MRDTLAAHLRTFSTAPFLFVGSGFSRRYLGSDTWEALLRRFAAYTPQPYEYYRATAGNDLPQVAAQIAKAFHEVWWKDKAFEDSRTRNAAHAKFIDSALKIEIAEYLHNVVDSADVNGHLAKEIDTLRKSVVDGIITTNWDGLLEKLFPEFRPFVGQDQLLFASPHGVGEIYKIHGCVSQPDSLVLTAADYDRFTQRNAYLAAKLLTVFVEHPVIFVGYSLTDRNVSQILRDIGACLTSANIAKLRDRLIFVTWDPARTDATISNSNIVVPDGYSIPIMEIHTESMQPVFDALVGLPRVFPARVLRRLKEHVYTLVRDNDPKRQLYVKDIDEADAAETDIEVVFGVGTIAALKDIGYRGISRNDLIIDLLDNANRFDASQIVEETLPRLLRHNKFIPVFRYLRLAGRLSSSGMLTDTSSLDQRVIKAGQETLEYFGAPQQYRTKAPHFVKQYKDFKGLASAMPADDVVMYASEFPEATLDPKDIKVFLDNNRALLTEPNPLIQTQFIKLVCIYDWLANLKGKGA